MKRNVTKWISLFVCASIFAGCNSQTNNAPNTTIQPSASTAAQSETGTSPKDVVVEAKNHDKEIVIKAFYRGEAAAKVEEPIVSEMMKEKFNMVFDKTYINTNDWLTKLNLMFATDEQIDFINNMRPDWGLREWVDAGYLKGFTLEELEKDFPNTFNLWNDKETFDYVYNLLKSPDKKLYVLPKTRDGAANMSWLYREDIFSKYNLKMPTNPEEMYQTLLTLKKETGKIPYVSQSSGVGAPLYAFAGFMQMFGINELQAREYYAVNPITKEFIPFGASTNNYREFLKFMNKLYKDGLVWEEYATATVDQRKKAFAQGNGLLFWGYPEGLAENDNLSQQENPEAKWTWTDQFPTSETVGGTIIKRDPYHHADLYCLGAEIAPESYERLMEYLNWALTEEGMMFQTYGKEGVTYEIKDGKPYYLERFKTFLKPTGDELSLFEIAGKGASIGGFIKTEPSALKTYKPLLDEINEKIVKNPKYSYYMAPVMDFTEEDATTLAEIMAGVAATRDEYTARFIMGNGIDPNNDADWDKYLSDLKKQRLDKLEEIVTEAYKRANP